MASKNTGPRVIPIERTRGDTFPLLFTVKSGNTPVDITSFQFWATVNPKENPPDGDANLAILPGTVVDGPNGQFQLEWTNDSVLGDPSMIAAGCYYYQLKMVDGSLNKRTIAKGPYIQVQTIDEE
jgi:hypothetical protein